MKLFGSIHGGQQRSSFGSTREVQLSPTMGMRNAISNLPSGTVIGVESLSPGDYEIVRRDFEDKTFDAFGEAGRYPRMTYWDDLVVWAESNLLPVVYLERKEPWFKYASAVVQKGLDDRKSRDELYREEGESDRDYHAKLIKHNNGRFRREVGVQNIHLLERDTSILEQIAEHKPGATFVGLGHSDRWILEQERLIEEYGIVIDTYCTDSIIPGREMEMALQFTEDAKPNKDIAYDFDTLRKKVSLLEKGTFTGEVPNWVGTWDYPMPMEGYFEVFLGNGSQGIIHDNLGIARFEGTITPEGCDFTKRYDLADDIAIRDEIRYVGVPTSRGLLGAFSDGRSFYMEPVSPGDYLLQEGIRTPFEIGMQMHDDIGVLHANKGYFKEKFGWE